VELIKKIKFTRVLKSSPQEAKWQKDSPSVSIKVSSPPNSTRSCKRLPLLSARELKARESLLLDKLLEKLLVSLLMRRESLSLSRLVLLRTPRRLPRLPERDSALTEEIRARRLSSRRPSELRERNEVTCFSRI